MSRRIDWEGQVGRQLRLRDLHAFFTVVHCRSMAKAALQLGVSQPAVSKIIADLEHALGVRLLDRSPQGVEPTVFGYALLKRGMAAFDELKQGIRDIEFLADPTAGEVKIGCPGNISSTLMPRIVEQFVQKIPRVLLHVDAVQDPQNLPGLHDRKYDLYLTNLPLPEHRVPEGLNVEFLFSDPLVVAAGMKHRWANRRKIDFAELAEESWLLPRTDSWNYICIADAFRTRGLPGPKIGLWSNDALLRTHLLAKGQFVTAIGKLNAAWYGLKALPIDLPVQPWPVVIATLKGRTLSPVVELFIEFVRDFTKPMRQAHKTTSRGTFQGSGPPPQSLSDPSGRFRD
ncbi:LysR family transcriptional regulator [Reyranella sp.]|uniref:LysR family transcriptional regulator n=1 Tax=Reyranella sp. TaxID=1929291 RepID=UPI0025D00945|nr:LysR family transcriptional regulator [Reyranella sp.]